MAFGDRSRQRGRTAVVAVAALVIGGVIFLVQGDYRARTEIVEATAGPGGLVTLYVDTCGGDPEVADVEEIDGEVRVAVRSTHELWGGDDCLDELQLSLDGPIGDRVLIDLETGEAVEVSSG